MSCISYGGSNYGTFPDQVEGLTVVSYRNPLAMSHLPERQELDGRRCILLLTKDTSTLHIGGGITVRTIDVDNSLCPRGALCIHAGWVKVTFAVERSVHVDTGKTQPMCQFKVAFHPGKDPKEDSFVCDDTKSGSVSCFMRLLCFLGCKENWAFAFYVETARQRQCVVCGNDATIACSHCKMVAPYCSRKCAAQDWDNTKKEHKHILKLRAKLCSDI